MKDLDGEATGVDCTCECHCEPGCKSADPCFECRARHDMGGNYCAFCGRHRTNEIHDWKPWMTDVHKHYFVRQTNG